MKHFLLRGGSEDCKGTRQKAGFVYRLLFIERCGVVNLSLVSFCKDVKTYIRKSEVGDLWIIYCACFWSLWAFGGVECGSEDWGEVFS